MPRNREVLAVPLHSLELRLLTWVIAWVCAMGWTTMSAPPSFEVVGVSLQVCAEEKSGDEALVAATSDDEVEITCLSSTTLKKGPPEKELPELPALQVATLGSCRIDDTTLSSQRLDPMRGRAPPSHACA